jgi:hydrogenase/urease accessory protein HupE
MAKYFENYERICEGANTCPIGVLLCAYMLGFGLAQKFLEIFQKSLSLGLPNTALCNVRCSGLALGGSAAM